jgi:hypothetical protein
MIQRAERRGIADDNNRHLPPPKLLEGVDIVL